MGKADQADAAEAVRLQKELRRRHEELAAVGADGRKAQLTKVFAATKTLLEFEAQVPRRRAERRRRVSSVIVYVAAGGAAAAMLGEVARMLLHQLSWWYLIAVVPVAAVAGVVAASEHRAPTEGHGNRAVAAVFTVLAAALVVVVTVQLVSAFWLAGLVLILPGAVGFWVDGPSESGEAQ